MGGSGLGTALIIGVVLVGGFLIFNKKTGASDILKNFGLGGLSNFFNKGSVTGNQPVIDTSPGGVVLNPTHNEDECAGFKGMGDIYTQCINSGKSNYARSYFAGGRYDGRGIGSRITIG